MRIALLFVFSILIISGCNSTNQQQEELNSPVPDTSAIKETIIVTPDSNLNSQDSVVKMTDSNSGNAQQIPVDPKIKVEKKVSESVGKKNQPNVNFPTDIKGVKWKLIELSGQPVLQSNEEKVIYFMIDSIDKRVYGFGGCNQFFGGYESKEPLQINFKKMTTTMMACDRMDIESGFLKVMGQTDNYSLNKNNLSLNKARMAPLAKFEVVK